MTENEIENATGEELLDKFRDQNKLWNFEGESGIRKLNKITRAIGYAEDGFLYGSSLEKFLQDNPGACDVIVEWIGKVIDDDGNWADELRDQIILEEGEETEDELTT